MRYRAMTPTGDYTFGLNGQNFFVNSRQAVRQAVETALKLFEGDWFLDLSAGVPYLQQIMGKTPQSVYDRILQQAIVNVQGVTGIVTYESSLNRATRDLTVTATVSTLYGSVTFTVDITTVPPYGYNVGPYSYGEPYGA